LNNLIIVKTVASTPTAKTIARPIKNNKVTTPRVLSINFSTNLVSMNPPYLTILDIIRQIIPTPNIIAPAFKRASAIAHQ